MENQYSAEETLYLKGARQRSEYAIQNAGSSMDRVTITQCDENLPLEWPKEEMPEID